MKAIIGCSGYYYRDWKGAFYPDTLPSSKWLEFYCHHFKTIEINASFHRFPTEKSLKKWYDETPGDFVFSIKAPKVITHLKKFEKCKEEIKLFYENSRSGLGDKLGSVLFQLPPSFAYSQENLQKLLENMNPDFNNVIEFRNASWWTEEVYRTLEDHTITFCTISHPTLKQDLIINNERGYLRFHGKPVLYKTQYSEEEIDEWVKKIKGTNVKVIYIYFNNTWGVGGVTNASHMLTRFR